MDFEGVDYWDELCAIMDWSLTNVTSTLHICWGAQAGLYHHYGIDKIKLAQKISGVYPHNLKNNRCTLLRGFDNTFFAPHSRWTAVCERSLKKCTELEVLADSDMVGAHIVTSDSGKQIFVLGHMEYDEGTLAEEYFRDLEKGENPAVPYNYFPGNDPKNAPAIKWRAHANLLFSNWLNYHVYQTTPYDIE